MFDPTSNKPRFTLLESHRRPLTDFENRVLRGRLEHLKSHGRRASRASLWIGIGVFAVLWILTLLTSEVSWVVVTLFWAVVGVGITGWVRRDLAKEMGEVSAMALGLESALRRDEADVFDVRASSFAEFEEVEDEGACYAFALKDGRVMFLSGQEFYPDTSFPCLNFSLAYIFDEQDRVVDMVLDKRGPRASPARTISSQTKWEMDLPESLAVFEGSLDNLEEFFGSSK